MPSPDQQRQNAERFTALMDKHRIDSITWSFTDGAVDITNVDGDQLSDQLHEDFDEPGTEMGELSQLITELSFTDEVDPRQGEQQFHELTEGAFTYELLDEAGEREPNESDVTVTRVDQGSVDNPSPFGYSIGDNLGTVGKSTAPDADTTSDVPGAGTATDSGLSS